MLTSSILGNGTSLYGYSEGKFNIDKIQENGFHEEDNMLLGEVYFFGTNTLPEQCTDDLIETLINCDEVYNHIDKFIKEQFGESYKYTQPSLVWSEKNRQPDSGWAFYLYASLQDEE